MSLAGYVSLKNIATVKGGKRLPKGEQLIEQKTPHPYIRVTDMHNGTLQLEPQMLYVPESVYPKIKSYTVSEHDVIISIVGTVGLVNIIGHTLDGANLTENCARIRTERHACVSRFLYYWLTSPDGKSEIAKRIVGSTQPKLPLYNINDIPISLPSLPIQHRIAEILGRLDDKIEVNRRINRTLEQMAQALYQHWFVDFGLFQDGEFVESELGPIPKGWQIGKLGDIARNERQIVDPRDVHADIPYIGLADMPQGSITLDSWGTAGTSVSAKNEMKRGQILFGKLRPYFKKVGVVPVDGICSTDILVITPRQPEHFGILLGQLIQQEFVDYTEAVSEGTRMPRVSWEMMAKYPICLPDWSTAQKFSGYLKSWVDTIGNNVSENRKLAEIRDYLLPKLLSGAISVDAAEELEIEQPLDALAAQPLLAP